MFKNKNLQLFYLNFKSWSMIVTLFVTLVTVSGHFHNFKKAHFFLKRSLVSTCLHLVFVCELKTHVIIYKMYILTECLFILCVLIIT